MIPSDQQVLQQSSWTGFFVFILDSTFMLAPALRNPCFSLYILATLIAAPTIFRCHAYPFREDLSIGVDGDLAHSNTTHWLGTRMDENDEDDNPPPYSSVPSNIAGPSNAGYNGNAYNADNNSDSEDGGDSDSDSDDDGDNYYINSYNNSDSYSNSENDSDRSGSDDYDDDNINNDEPPPYTFQVHFVSDVDEEKRTARINDLKDVRLEVDPVELGKNDRDGLSRKYYVVDPTRKSDEVKKPAVLKIVDLLKARRLNKDVPDLLRKEGSYWEKGEGNMLLWETDSPIEKRDRRGRLVKWEYMVMYRAAHSGVIFGDSGPAVSKPLGFIGDWALTWESESVVNLMLGQCKYAAMKTHKRLQAEEEMEINDYDLNKWVTDEGCKIWLPNEINVAFNYRREDGMTVRAKGAKDLTLGSLDYDAHFQNVEEELKRKFHADSVKKHIKHLAKARKERGRRRSL